MDDDLDQFFHDDAEQNVRNSKISCKSYQNLFRLIFRMMAQKMKRLTMSMSIMSWRGKNPKASLLQNSLNFCKNANIRMTS